MKFHGPVGSKTFIGFGPQSDDCILSNFNLEQWFSSGYQQSPLYDHLKWPIGCPTEITCPIALGNPPFYWHQLVITGLVLRNVMVGFSLFRLDSAALLIFNTVIAGTTHTITR